MAGVVRAQRATRSPLARSASILPSMIAFRFIRLLCAFAVVAMLLPLAAQAKDATHEPKVTEAPLTIANREITTFRGTVLGIAPAARAERARNRIDALEYNDLSNPVRALPATVGDLQGAMILVGDKQVFSLLPADLDPEGQLTLEQASESARAALAQALEARRSLRQWPVLLRGLLHAAVVTVVLVAAVWLVHRGGQRLTEWLGRVADSLTTRSGAAHWREYLVRLLIRLLQLGRWIVVLALLYGWLTYVLEHFPITEPLGKGLAAFIVSLIAFLADGALASLPGIATVVVVVFVTRAIIEVIGQFFESVQTGRTKVPFVHPDTAGATRRIVVFVAWALALVVAYPFIPGSDSDVFKGLSVLVGVVVSLGSTGLVTQMMSGLVVVYSRALRKNDFVAVNGVEGMVTEVGAFATKVVTMRNEEVTIPNAVLIGNPIHNFSKLAGAEGTLLSTKVTIGYDAPWRQVHAMLEQAAARTPELRGTPKPVVYQRALSDFYAEYELFVHVDNPLRRVAALSALHANIQDLFNEHGVQILSPHFVLQPKHAVVVPPDKWYAPPATPPDPGS